MIMFKKYVSVLILLFILMPVHANYQILSLPFSQEMTRNDIEEIVGKPGFLIYTKLVINGMPGYLDISIAGYRMPGKGSKAKLATVIFFEEQIQLLASVFYEPKVQAQLIKKVASQKGFKEQKIGEIPGYFNEESLDLYLGAKSKTSIDFPPEGLKSYLNAETALNHQMTQAVLKALLTQVKEAPQGLSSMTYTNLRLLASIATQSTLSRQWQR